MKARSRLVLLPLFFAAYTFGVGGCSQSNQRFGIPKNSKYSQSTPEECLRSIRLAIGNSDYAYMLAHLCDLDDDFSQGAFNLMSSAYEKGHEDESISKIRGAVDEALASGKKWNGVDHKITYDVSHAPGLTLSNRDGNWRLANN